MKPRARAPRPLYRFIVACLPMRAAAQRSARGHVVECRRSAVQEASVVPMNSM